MKASSRQQQLLLQLQDLDHTIARLQRRKAKLPERAQLTALQDEADHASHSFMSVQRELDAQNNEIERLESDLELARQRVKRDHELLAVSSSSKEAQALQHELDALERRRVELEERELTLMEAAEHTQQRYREASLALGDVDQRRSEIQAVIERVERELDAELSEAAASRAHLQAELQQDLLQHYETLRARIGVGAARLRGNISEASNMQLSPAELSTILHTDPGELAYCPHSGAILVREIPETS